MKQETIEARLRGDLNRGIAAAITESQVGGDLERDPRDDEQVTVTRRQLRIMVRTMLEIKLKDHVLLETVQ